MPKVHRRRTTLAAVAAFTVVICVCTVAPSFSYHGWQRGPWEKYDNKDHMTMWLNEDVTTGVDGVRVDTLVDIPANQLFPALTDEERQKEYSFIREFKILKKYHNWGYLYQRVQSTGIQDRDFTVKLVMVKPKHENAGPYGWVWRQANDKGPPPRDGVVRAEHVAGSYLLTPVGKNHDKTLVSYRLWFDPSSWVPDFLINMAVRDAAYETVRKIRKDAVRMKH